MCEDMVVKIPLEDYNFIIDDEDGYEYSKLRDLVEDLKDKCNNEVDLVERNILLYVDFFLTNDESIRDTYKEEFLEDLQLIENKIMPYKIQYSKTA